MTQVIGLTGGIACGKSTVARHLVELGATLVDADVIAREVVEPGSEGLAAIVARFGEEMADEVEGLRRKRLGALVFSDGQALAELNALLHPKISALIERRLESARRQGDPFVVIDAALLVEMGLHEHCDQVVVVDAPVKVQIERIAARDGLDGEQAQARIEAQATRERRLDVADFVIENAGDLAALNRQVDAFWQHLRANDESTRSP